MLGWEEEACTIGKIKRDRKRKPDIGGGIGGGIEIEKKRVNLWGIA